MTRMLTFVLALIVALTSQQLALARGQAIATDEVTLCAGGGFVTLTLGSDGRPAGMAEICPDGVLSFAGATDVPHLPLWQAVGRVAQVPAIAPAQLLSVPRVIPQARAPPILI